MQRNYYIIYFLICLYVLWLEKKGPLWGRSAARVQRGQKERFLRWTGPMGRRVLKFDGPLARGLWYRPIGDEYKVSVTGLAFCVIWHDKHSGDWLTAFANRVEIIHPSHTTVRTVRYTAVQFLGQIIFS